MVNLVTSEDRSYPTSVITFTDDDLKGVHLPHDDPLVISLQVDHCQLGRVLIDGGSGVDILFWEAFQKMGLKENQIRPSTMPILGFNSQRVYPKGVVRLTVVAAERALSVDFLIIDSTTSYNAIMGRNWIHRMQGQLQQDQPACLKGINLEEDQEKPQVTLDTLEQVGLDDADPSKTILISTKLSGDERQTLIRFLKTRMRTFAWTPHDMPGIDPSIMSHSLNISNNFPPVKQKQRRFAPEVNQVIQEEVQWLLSTGAIEECLYPIWLANPVVVPKKNGKKRVCIDYINLNKVCPKDSYPLPKID
ncbi:uncharacterized protein LOC133795378 [Humulus lupulus]|uniref:uncharacterized protein LOC133795378 n=1 Tax=Humulus lupulus TaxID=3486 RepID=UPI002B409DFA|nr:uncharacterized protein LOC133795378 [Humulus lupulus]